MNGTEAHNHFSQNGNSAEESPKWLPVDRKFSTLAIHAVCSSKEEPTGAVVPSITLSTTFEQEGPGVPKGYMYTRYGNPIRSQLEKALAALEKGKHAFAYSSGHGAILNVVSLFKHGDNIIAPDSMYEGTGTILKQVANTSGVLVDFIDMTDLSQLENSLKPSTKLVWIETPANPTLKVYDIQEIVKIVRNYSKDIVLTVDNTFLTPYFQRPLTLGADISLHSLSKYGGGHSDILMGAIITNRDDLADRLRFLQKVIGAVPAPMDCSLMIRSLKTLAFRMPIHMKNGLAVARFLQKHPKVETVLHPGLPSHPTHQIALKQSSGHSGMVSFIMKDGAGCTIKFLKGLKLIYLADSLGGIESLAKAPSIMAFCRQQAPSTTSSDTPVKVTEDDKKRDLEITKNFIRLSIGLEDEEDLIEDLTQALKNC